MINTYSISPLCSFLLLIEMLASYTINFWEQYTTDILHIMWCYEGIYVSEIVEFLEKDMWSWQRRILSLAFSSFKIAEGLKLASSVSRRTTVQWRSLPSCSRSDNKTKILLQVAPLLHVLTFFDGDNLVTAYVFGQWRVCNLVLFIFNGNNNFLSYQIV